MVHHPAPYWFHRSIPGCNTEFKGCAHGGKVEVLDGFVALEGLDGAGTTTQLGLVAAIMRRRGLECHETCEPTHAHFGLEIRRILRGERRVHPCTLALLFAADRNEHVHDSEDGMLAHLRRGEIVITDRYLFSSLAYQSVECGYDYVLALNRRFPLPRHLVYIDTPVEVCQDRLRARSAGELFDSERMQRSVLAAYDRVLGEFSGSGMRVLHVDGTRRPETISEEICAALQGSMPILGV